ARHGAHRSAHPAYVSRARRSAASFSSQQLGTGPDVAIAVDDSEGDIEAVEPLVVVDARPVEQPANVDASADGLVGDLQATAQVLGPSVVVVGADAEFRDEQRNAIQLLVE